MLALPLASSDLHLDLEMRFGDSSYENSKGSESLAYRTHIQTVTEIWKIWVNGLA